jgi:hypothetical protein
MVVLVAAGPPGGAQQSSLAVGSDPTAVLSGSQASSVFVNPANDSSPSGGGGTMTSLGGTDYGPSDAAESNLGQAWIAWVSPGANPVAAASPGTDGTIWAIVPLMRFVELSGTLNPGQPSITFQIPVDPTTRSLDLRVRPADGEPRGEMPFVEKMDLVNPTGTTMEEVAPDSGAGSDAPDAVTVLLHNAPTGGHLMVQIGAAVESSTTTGSGIVSITGTSQPADWKESFVMDVQRQEAQAPTQDGASLPQAQETLGTLIVAAVQQPGTDLSSSTWSSPAAEAGGTALDGQAPTTLVASASNAPDPATESFDIFDVRVPTGPLASRSAGPLGPTLAVIDADPTQPVDRHERALSQEIEGLGAGDGAATTASRFGPRDEEPSAVEGDRAGGSGFIATSGPVVAIPGRGGFPFKVTSQGRGQRVQLTALWATLPSAADPESAVPSSAEAKIPLAPAAVYRSSSDPLECPDYVKAACGVALGLGMTSGFLFPDVIASLPRRRPKWLVALRARTRRAESPASNRSRLRRIPSWLRDLF